MPRTWVLLPAFDEEPALPTLLGDFAKLVESSTLDLRLIVVDDGSSDRTAAIAEEAARSLPLELLRHDANRGLGAAVRTGLDRILDEASDDDGVATLDSDGSQSPAFLPAMVEALEGGCDVVIASRYRPGSRVAGVPPLRLVASGAARILFGWLAPMEGVRDYTCGYRLYRAGALRRAREAVPGLPTEPGFACQVEVLATISGLQGRVREVPFTLRYDQKASSTKLRWLDTIRGNLRVLAAARRALRRSATGSS